MPMTIDPFSAAARPLQLLFNGTLLSTATSFVWKADENYWLVTNWHNFSGRNPYDGKHVSKTGAEPNSLIATLFAKGSLNEGLFQKISLRDENNQPLWIVHPNLGRAVDVAAIQIPEEFVQKCDMYAINVMHTEDLSAKVGADVFILGYPLGPSLAFIPPFAPGLIFFPVWKRGSIASEPEMLFAVQNHFLIDTASRPGMSGAPVIFRQPSRPLVQGKNVIGIDFNPSTRFIGVYSGRVGSLDTLDAQLGICWPAHLLEEIIAGGKRDTI